MAEAALKSSAALEFDENLQRCHLGQCVQVPFELKIREKQLPRLHFMLLRPHEGGETGPRHALQRREWCLACLSRC